MATKSIEHEDGAVISRTVNGAPTTTEMVYDLVDFKITTTPLPNGFDKELADYLYTFISTPKTLPLWDQNAWRRVVNDPESISEQEDYEYQKIWRTRAQDEQDAAQALTSPKADRCGTAMCCAGWIGEMSGVDWVADAAWLRADRLEGRDSDSLMSLVLVRNDWLREKLGDELYDTDLFVERRIAYEGRWAWSDETYVRRLAERGFGPETHRIMGVAEYASIRLGIGRAGEPMKRSGEPCSCGCNLSDFVRSWERDPLSLFGGANTLPEIERIIQGYAEWNDDLTWERISVVRADCQELRAEAMADA